MTDAQSIAVEAVAKALARHPGSSWDDYEWEDVPSYVRGLYLEKAALAIAAMPAPSDQEKLVESAYLVWSNEHSAWWGRDRCGYTRIIANAGRYSRAEALEIAGTRGGGWYVRKGNPDEIAIPESDAIDQYADITRAQDAEAITRTRARTQAKGAAS